MRRSLPFILGLALILALGCSADERSPEKADPATSYSVKLDSLAPALLRDHDVPGLGVGVVEDGRVVYTHGYGLADQGTNRPVTAATLFNVASVSKPVTAWGVLHLADDQDISLDLPVNDRLTRWRLPDSAFDTQAVTVRRLLSHTAGTSVPSVPWFPADTTRPRLEQVLRGEAGDQGPVKVERKPGARWSYSGGGYAVLQLFIEEVTEQSFPAYMQQAVFEPLGMSRTTFDPSSVSGPEIATPYDEDGAAIEPYRLVGEAAGGLYSTVEDFARLLTAYTHSGRNIMSESSFEAMLTPMAQVEIEGMDLGGAEYALGHAIHQTDSGERLVYHSGGNPGYIAYFIVAPERGDGVVIVANGSNAVPVIAGVLASWSEHYGFDLPPLF